MLKMFRIALLVSFTCVSLPASSVTRQPVAADHGMVVTSQHLASEIGIEILKLINKFCISITYLE